MNAIFKIVSFLGLGLTLVPPILLFNGMIGADLQKSLMLAGTVCWFATAPFWMNEEALEV